MPPVVTTRRQALLDGNYVHVVYSPAKRKRTIDREKQQKESRKKEHNKSRTPPVPVPVPTLSPLEAHFGGGHMAGVKGFQDSLEQTCERLLGLAETMAAIDHNTDIAPAIRDEIDTFIGQVRLLVTSKLRKQFGKMLSDAVDPAYAPPTKLEDLTGFWEMVGIQIGKADETYVRLDKLRQNGWVEEVEEEVVKKTALKPKAKTNKPALSAKAAEASKARAEKMKAFKAAQMKAMKAGKENEEAVV